jgi:phosphoglycerol transferase MdoB-like AlkP superfamily enzyme
LLKTTINAEHAKHAEIRRVESLCDSAVIVVFVGFMFLAQQAPIVVRFAPKKDPTGLADVLLGALGLTGVLVLGALVLGAAFAALLFLIRSRKPLDH